MSLGDALRDQLFCQLARAGSETRLGGFSDLFVGGDEVVVVKHIKITEPQRDRNLLLQLAAERLGEADCNLFRTTEPLLHPTEKVHPSAFRFLEILVVGLLVVIGLSEAVVMAIG